MSSSDFDTTPPLHCAPLGRKVARFCADARATAFELARRFRFWVEKIDIDEDPPIIEKSRRTHSRCHFNASPASGAGERRETASRVPKKRSPWKRKTTKKPSRKNRRRMKSREFGFAAFVVETKIFSTWFFWTIEISRVFQSRKNRAFLNQHKRKTGRFLNGKRPVAFVDEP
jgi:hypothetical protein